MRPLRFALNHTRLAPSGGVEGYIWNLLRFLLDRGHSVDFFAGKFTAMIEHAGFRALRVQHLRVPQSLRVASFASSSRRAIEREERKQRYDIVQGFSRTYYHTIYRDGSGCREDYRELYLAPHARRGLRRALAAASPLDAIVRRIERKRYVDRPQRMVIAISGFVRDQILRRYPVPPENVRVVYSGVDCERFHPRRREGGRAKLRALAGNPQAPGERYLAFVGNDYLRKGLDIALGALASLRRAGTAKAPVLRLFVAGRDPRSARFEGMAQALGLGGTVHFLGPRDDVPDILAGADVLLLPSRFDAYANVSSESLASGTPVIASATSGAAELIRPEHGWVLERNEAGDLARMLIELSAGRDLSPLRSAARDAALALSWERHYAELEGIYGEVIEREGAAEGAWRLR
jgi:UDP-glucose:(heptosyl)LPS alpha-1,3-glucosyltransferase